MENWSCYICFLQNHETPLTETVILPDRSLGLLVNRYICLCYCVTLNIQYHSHSAGPLRIRTSHNHTSMHTTKWNCDVTSGVHEVVFTLSWLSLSRSESITAVVPMAVRRRRCSDRLSDRTLLAPWQETERIELCKGATDSLTLKTRPRTGRELTRETLCPNCATVQQC